MNATETTDRAADARPNRPDGQRAAEVKREKRRQTVYEKLTDHLDDRTTEQLEGYLKSFARQDEAADARDDDGDVDEQAAEVAAESDVADDGAPAEEAKPHDARQAAYDVVRAHIDQADALLLFGYEAAFVKVDRDQERMHENEKTDNRRMRLGTIMHRLARIKDDDDLDFVAHMAKLMCHQ